MTHTLPAPAATRSRDSPTRTDFATAAPVSMRESDPSPFDTHAVRPLAAMSLGTRSIARRVVASTSSVLGSKRVTVPPSPSSTQTPNPVAAIATGNWRAPGRFGR